MDLAREGETITGKNIAWKVNSAFKSYNVTNSQASRIAKRLPNVEISGKLGYSRTLGSGGSSALVFRYTGEIPKERVLLSSKEKKARRVGGYARHGLHKGEKE